MDQGETMGKEIEKSETESMLGPTQYKLYKWRFVVLIVFTYASMTASIMNTPWSACQNQIETIYQQSSFVVTSCTQIYMVLYVPFVFVANWLIDTYSPYPSMIIGSILTTLGCWIRILINQGFYWVLIGQTFGGIGSPLLLGCAAKISALWFSPTERALATTVASLSHPFGTILSFALQAVYIRKKFEEQQYREEGKDAAFNYILIQSILISVACLCVILFFRARPPTPPSNSSKQKRDPFCQSIKMLIKNNNFLVFYVGFTLLWSIYFALGTQLSKLTNAFGYSPLQNSIAGVTVVLTGTVGSILFSKIAGKTHKYKLMHLALTLASLIIIILTYFALHTQLFWLGLIAIGLFGFTLIPNLPLAYEFASELVYPVGEGTVVGLLMLLVQFLGIGMINAIDQVTNPGRKIDVFYAVIIIGVVVLLSFVFFFFVKQDLRRLRVDQQKKEEDDGIITSEKYVPSDSFKNGNKSPKNDSNGEPHRETSEGGYFSARDKNDFLSD